MNQKVIPQSSGNSRTLLTLEDYFRRLLEIFLQAKEFYQVVKTIANYSMLNILILYLLAVKQETASKDNSSFQ